MAYRTPSKTQPPLIRPSFRAAIRWLAENDDCEWLDAEEFQDGTLPMSVAALLVVDLFGATEERVIKSLRRARARQR
jgi:hypothetical protein